MFRNIMFLIIFLFLSFANSQICYWGKYDIVFVTDVSGSIDDSEFAQLKNFLHGFVSDLHIDYFFVNVGIVEFGTNTELTLPIAHDYNYVTSFTGGDEFVRFEYGGTQLHLGIELTNQVLYEYGTRNVQKIQVLMTDGATGSPSTDTTLATEFKDKGGIVFSIGIGNGVNENHLRGLSSKNGDGDDLYFHADDFGALESVKAALGSELPCGLNPILMFFVYLPFLLGLISLLLCLLALIGGLGLFCLQKYVPPPQAPNNTEKSMYYVAGKQVGISWGDKGLGMDSMYRPGQMGMGDNFGSSKRTKFEGLKAKRESVTQLDVMDPKYKQKKKKKCTIL